VDLALLERMANHIVCCSNFNKNYDRETKVTNNQWIDLVWISMVYVCSLFVFHDDGYLDRLDKDTIDRIIVIFDDSSRL
jgi:hypothetical protein